MAQETNKTVMWVIVVGAVLAIMLLGGFYIINQKASDAASSAADTAKSAAAANAAAAALNAKVDGAIASIPTAAQIASQIVIPAATPSTTTVSYDDADVLQGIYSTEAHKLQTDCINGLQDKFDTSDVKNLIQDTIEASNEPIKNLVITNWNYQDQYLFKATNLGLDVFADRSAKITDVIRVSYKNEDGNQDTINDKIYVTAICDNWNIRTDEFRILTVDFSL
jgi:hypothetical protein